MMEIEKEASAAGRFFRIDATADELMARARSVAGIDIVDREVAEGALPVLLQSLNTEAQLSERGARDMEQRILRILINRLRMLRDYAAHPEIAEQVIVPPVMLTGAPRTGSTKLHKLLAASGDFRFLPFWQAHAMSLRSGDRGESADPRIQEASEYIDWYNRRAPKARLIHGYGTFEPEEETLLCEQGDDFGFLFCTVAWVPSYANWLWMQGFERQIDFLIRALKYLQWQFPEPQPRRWLLKYPAYQGFEPLLASRFQGATLIATYRDPVKTLSSMVSLMADAQGIYSDVDRHRPLGPFMLEGQRQRMLLFMKSRAENPQVRLHDVAYPDLTHRAEKVIEDIYGFMGHALTEHARSAMLGWDRDNSQHKHGVHTHDLADIDLTPDMVRTAFQPYMEQYGHLF